MDPRRMILVSLATAFGCAIAGCLVGGGLGVVVPGLYRFSFGVADGSPFDPLKIGLGVGGFAGFFVGSAIVVVGLLVALIPGLVRWRPFVQGVLQPTLSGLALVVAVVAVGFASLRNPSRLGVEAWFGLAVLSLVGASLVIIANPPGSRGFAAGFAVVGWSYLLLSLLPESRSQLPTTRLLAVLERQVSGSWKMGVHHLSLETGSFPARVRGAYWEPVITSRGGLPGVLEIDEVQPEFRRIGHSLLTLISAVLGGLAVELGIARHRTRPNPPMGDESSRVANEPPSIPEHQSNLK